MADSFRGSKRPDTRIAEVLLLLAVVGTVAYNVLGRFALGLSEDSAATSFGAYQRHRLPIFLTFAGGTLAGLLFIVLAPVLASSFGRRGAVSLRVAAVCQALAGVMLVLSASRWLIVLPALKRQYDSPLAGAATRAAVEVDYQTISYFFGITLGEHLFAILTGAWTLIWAVHLLRLPSRRSRLNWLGIVGGCGWLLGSLEQLDFSLAGYFLVFLGGGPLIWLLWAVSLTSTLVKGSDGVGDSRERSSRAPGPNTS